MNEKYPIQFLIVDMIPVINKRFNKINTGT